MGRYFCVMNTGNVDGKGGLRLLGSWMCRSATPEDIVANDMACKIVLKIGGTIFRSNGTALLNGENGKWSVQRHVNNKSATTLAEVIRSFDPLSSSDDRFQIANKIIQGEVMREMKPSSDDPIPPQYRYEKDVCYDFVAIDCIILVDLSENLSSFFKSIIDGLDKYVRKFRKKTGQIQHFWYDSKLLTIAVPSETTMADRLDLHSELNIPTDRPVFTESMNIYFKPPTKLLRALHKFVPISNMESVTVDGEYCYYHYMVDKGLDDKGWGCAYRSLQTICSWFLLNGYASRPVPTIRQIQEMLVLIGDKQLPFINSPKWIGTMEASYILEHYLDVSCRIIHLNDIKELSDNFFTLLSHFRNTRCPVMIGGGTLAHTLLGVCHNEEKQTQKYLVLDPHYSEEDVIANVIEKGFCGWKDTKFWKSSTYYNLCLPIPPKIV